MKKYQEMVNEFVKKDWTLPTKLYMVYELSDRLDIQLEDDLVDKLFCAYLDSHKHDNISSFVDAIDEWTAVHGWRLETAEDYKKMLDEIER